MQIVNQVNPSSERIKQFFGDQEDGLFVMVNLLKFKAKAVYEDGRDTDLTGREAYRLYGKAFKEIMGPQGVTVLYSGEMRGTLIGQGDDLWDAVALIQYPSTRVMLDMLRNDEYQRAQQHRAAGLEGQLLIECGAGFEF